MNALTVGDLAERFIAEHVDVHLKPRTADGYKRNLKKFILPMIGHLKITDVTRADYYSISPLPTQIAL